MSKHDLNNMKQLRTRIEHADVCKIVLGAGDVWHGDDWIATNQEELDILETADWEFLFAKRKPDFILAEHVWEHFTATQAYNANRNVYNFLAPDGNFRVAVPDGYFPDQSYIDAVKPGGTGAGADDHKILYNHISFLRSLHRVPFRVKLLEYFDRHGEFHYEFRDEQNMGIIRRSKYHDERNVGPDLKYTSIIADCFK